MTYASDRAWSDAYLAGVRTIVGPLLLVPAPLERDISEATDLIVMRARDMTIAVRLRRPGFAGRYPGEFTIRSRRDTGAKTELKKIVDGWGDWLFYGHTSLDGGIPEWTLVDLHRLRALFIRQPDILHRPDGRLSGNRSNKDGTHFMWFNAANIRPSVEIAHSDRHERAA